eukprot:1160646-Pelagomonas_calceolata.AAC.6
MRTAVGLILGQPACLRGTAVGLNWDQPARQIENSSRTECAITALHGLFNNVCDIAKNKIQLVGVLLHSHTRHRSPQHGITAWHNRDESPGQQWPR